MAAQLVHAAGESSPGNLPPNTHAIVLSAPSEDALVRTYEKLLDAGISCTLIREPDAPWNGAVMALGCAPAPRQKIRRLLSGLPLLREGRIMTTDNTYSLIQYRPNGSEYIGGGENEHYNSEICFDHNLTLEQLKRRINEHTRRHRYKEENDCELIVLKDGKPIVCRGESLWSFEEGLEASDETGEICDMIREAGVLSEQEKIDAREAKRQKEEAERKAYYAEQERKRYSEAKRTVDELKSKYEKVTP